MERRAFLSLVGATTAAPLLGNAWVADMDRPRKPEEIVRMDMRYRTLGRTGEQVSVIGIGGHHIGRQKDEQVSIAIIRAATDAGTARSSLRRSVSHSGHGSSPSCPTGGTSPGGPRAMTLFARWRLCDKVL